MSHFLVGLAQPLLARLEPETAHRLAIAGLRALPGRSARPSPASLGLHAFGLRFANPLGMAAGFDKNGEACAGLFNAGFGFVEIGTLTPRPQAGNIRPRLFRLERDGALINRLGFNNHGYAAAYARLSADRPAGILGINIGPNKDAADRIGDYVEGLKRFSDVASYFTINVSSPNTPGLRDLQQREGLDALMARVLEAREVASIRRPVLVKIAPDLDLAALDDVVEVARARAIDGMIISNTTLARPASLQSQAQAETGGLSGRPLFAASTRLLAQAYLRIDGAFPLIGCGGVDSANATIDKLEAGASLVQLYTALIYRGPRLIEEILDALAATLAQRGLTSVAALTGVKAKQWAGVN